MKLYNSETRKVEEFVPHNKNEVTMYTCGPTVYHYAHIGNLRSYIMEDILERALNYLGFNVKRAMNITDVGHLSSDGDTGEDKMLIGAEREHKSVMEIAAFYTEAFKKDFFSLNLKWPEIVVPATDCIDYYIKMVSRLLENGFAYKSGGNIYFNTSKLKEYYRLTNQGAKDLVVGARDDVSEDESKKNPNDFVLWFTKSKFENHALRWDSPWGTGYPGWHIECSGISLKYLGEYLDIHCGGVDNKFPHHTNEIAQTESVVGHKWCSYWFHVEHLNTTNGKMSKSSGNFLTLTKLAEDGFSPMVYKFFCLQSHYRRQLVFSEEGLKMAKNAYEKLIKKLNGLTQDNSLIDDEKFNALSQKFKDALSQDLNTSLALTCVFDVLKSDANTSTKIALIKSFDSVLNLNLVDAIGKNQDNEATAQVSSNIDSNFEKYILEKIEERKMAKQNKDYAKADAIRSELLQMGVVLIDTKDGTNFTINK
ncbi:MAG: cysteine--tRNA ligase [Clostridia bacterium]|nr:cysteine--tRNA ligase [Clostridia bacterium]